MSKKRSVLFVILGSAVGLSVGIGIVWWLVGEYDGRPQQLDDRIGPQQPFSRDAWLDADENARRAMAMDLESNHLLIGMARTELLDSLGTPSSKTRLLKYEIGNGLAIRLYLDDSWRVAKVDEAGMPRADDATLNCVPFDALRWRAGDAMTRRSMVHDLLTHSELIGKSRSEVIKLLGEPSMKANTVYYSLGQTVDKGWDFDHPCTWSFDVYLDDNDIVRSTAIVEGS
ncbi:MAG: hypothetical protein JXA69_18145 [Phycisphaerae bacterium]|nr:hypothetical protein [Phycisphaerae bacterium]